MNTLIKNWWKDIDRFSLLGFLILMIIGIILSFSINDQTIYFKNELYIDLCLSLNSTVCCNLLTVHTAPHGFSKRGYDVRGGCLKDVLTLVVRDEDV